MVVPKPRGLCGGRNVDFFRNANGLRNRIAKILKGFYVSLNRFADVHFCLSECLSGRHTAREIWNIGGPVVFCLQNLQAQKWLDTYA